MSSIFVDPINPFLKMTRMASFKARGLAYIGKAAMRRAEKAGFLGLATSSNIAVMAQFLYLLF
jgi:hypothetical protein